MSGSKTAFSALILACTVSWSCAAAAQSGAATVPSAAPSVAGAGSQTAADPIGSVATLQGQATVAHNSAASALAVSDPIYKGDILQTGTDGTLGITFDDDTTFTLSPNSRIALDDFVYRTGGTGNAATFNVIRGTVAFVAAEVAKTGDMKIATPTASLGIRGTTGLIEITEGTAAGAAGPVNIKLYPDADGRVGRIEVVGRDGTQLGVLTRGTTGFAVRPGAAGRLTAVPLQISAEEAARDRLLVQRTFSAQRIGRQINIQRRTLRQRNPQRLPGRPEPGRTPGLERQPGQAPLQHELGVPPGQPRAPGGQRKPPPRRGQDRDR